MLKRISNVCMFVNRYDIYIYVCVCILLLLLRSIKAQAWKSHHIALPRTSIKFNPIVADGGYCIAFEYPVQPVQWSRCRSWSRSHRPPIELFSIQWDCQILGERLHCQKFGTQGITDQKIVAFQGCMDLLSNHGLPWTIFASKDRWRYWRAASHASLMRLWSLSHQASLAPKCILDLVPYRCQTTYKVLQVGTQERHNLRSSEGVHES